MFHSNDFPTSDQHDPVSPCSILKLLPTYNKEFTTKHINSRSILAGDSTGLFLGLLVCLFQWAGPVDWDTLRSHRIPSGEPRMRHRLGMGSGGGGEAQSASTPCAGLGREAALPDASGPSVWQWAEARARVHARVSV